MYADFEYYRVVYGGTDMSDTDYFRIARKADGFINRITFGRLQHGWTVTDAVKMAACAVADEIFTQQGQAAALIQGIKSENNDGYSTTYEDAAQQQQTLQRKQLEAAELYLPPYHPLRYAGNDRRKPPC